MSPRVPWASSGCAATGVGLANDLAGQKRYTRAQVDAEVQAMNLSMGLEPRGRCTGCSAARARSVLRVLRLSAAASSWAEARV